MRVYQIYFKPEQLANLEPEYIPYNNAECTVFFESEVMRSLIERNSHRDTDYFGVVSHKLRVKLGFTKDNWKNNKNIHNTSTQEFTPTAFQRQVYEAKPDVMSFQRHSPHDTVMVANGFHPGFLKYWTQIMSRIGYKWEPTRFEDVFYCNYFVAKSEIYERYVREMLAPAMDEMVRMAELWSPCRYPDPLPGNLQSKFGIEHWPFHAFLCERMFTYFAHIHRLNCKHY